MFWLDGRLDDQLVGWFVCGITQTDPTKNPDLADFNMFNMILISFFHIGLGLIELEGTVGPWRRYEFSWVPVLNNNTVGKPA